MLKQRQLLDWEYFYGIMQERERTSMSLKSSTAVYIRLAEGFEELAVCGH